MLRYLTAGESHGPALTAIVEGFPSGVALDTELDRPRARSVARGDTAAASGRQLETDRIIVDSGTYHGVTTGRPITLRLINNDAKLERLHRARRAPGRPHRPGRRDQLPDRHPPGARTRQRPRDGPAGRGRGAGQAPARASWGSRSSATSASWAGSRAPPLSFDLAVRDASPVYTLNPEADPAIVAAIDAAQEAGDTLGGIVETIVDRLPDRPGEPRPVGPQARRPAGRWP